MSDREIARLRRRQAERVMRLIGPMLDAWEGMPFDLRGQIVDEAPGFASTILNIEEAMEGDDE